MASQDHPPIADSDQPEGPLRDEHLRSLGLMLAAFAHELNTPIGVIACQFDHLQRCQQKLSAILAKPALANDDLVAMREVVAHMEKGRPTLEIGIERTRALVNELRLAARGDGPGPLEPTPLVEILEGNLLLLNHVTRQGITVTRRFEAQPVVQGRAPLLAQVFLNLLRNAAEAVGDRGTVTVTVQEKEGQAIVEVADDGPGVPPEILDCLFTRQCTSKTSDAGTGIGLYWSSRVLTKHGGRIDVRNQPDGGAVFTVTLPLA